MLSFEDRIIKLRNYFKKEEYPFLGMSKEKKKRFQKTDETIQPRPKRQLYNTQENEDYTKLVHFHISLSAVCTKIQ